jgi:hypothetical protein
MKNLNREAFLNKLEQKEWDNIYYSQDPNEMWHTWKNMLMEIIDKHAPLKAMLHGAIFLATCNAILLLRDVKLPNTSLHYTQPLSYTILLEDLLGINK